MHVEGGETPDNLVYLWREILCIRIMNLKCHISPLMYADAVQSVSLNFLPL